MYLLYVDHSGELYNAKEKYFVIGGVAVFERQIYFLERGLEGVQEDLLPSLSEKVEFHASPILHGREAPWDKMTQQTRAQVMMAVYDVIANAHSGICLFGQAVEKSAVVPDFERQLTQALEKKKQAEVTIKNTTGTERRNAKQSLREAKEETASLANQVLARGFEGLCTQFEFFLRRFYDAAEPERQQRGLMIFDHASYERELEFLMEQFRLIGTQVAQVYNITEVPLFTRSDATRMLQIADFVSHCIFRRYELGDTRYFDKVANRFDEHDGVVHGLAHVHSGFLTTCMCPACLTRRMRRSSV